MPLVDTEVLHLNCVVFHRKSYQEYNTNNRVVQQFVQLKIQSLGLKIYNHFQKYVCDALLINIESFYIRFTLIKY